MTVAVLSGPAAGFAASLISYALTGAVRRYALRRSILDVPNERSSHTVPTPLGGGLAISVVSLAGIALAGALDLVPVRILAALLGGGAAIAVVGWLADRYRLSAVIRLAAHFLTAGWALHWLGGLPAVGVGWSAVSLGSVGQLVVVVGIAWAVNSYNFMDGIDGLAGTEAVAVGSLGGTLLLASGDPSLALVAFLIAGSAGGFLVWNWAPAKVFMGDVGSGLLGYYFAILAVASERAGSLPLVIWVVLLGAFGYDATVTLIRRVLRREAWYRAHRSHAYQRAVQAGWTHSEVCRAVLGIDLTLGLLAWMGWWRPHLLPVALVTAVAILTGVYWRVERLRPMPPRD